MRQFVLLLAPFLMAQTEPQPLVPEGIHSPSTEAPNLCGLTAAGVDALQQKVMSDRGFREENSDDHYRVFNREGDFVQIVFPRPGYLSFPMVTCIQLFEDSNGTTVRRQMHCGGTREQCDRIFLEWNAHDNEVRQSLHSNERG